MRRDAGAEDLKTLLDRLGLVGATYYHVGIEQLDRSRADAFGVEMAKYVASGVQTLVVDLEDVQFMDSGAVRHLAVSQRDLMESGRKGIVLLDTPDQIKAKLDMAGFLEIFDFRSSKEPDKKD